MDIFIIYLCTIILTFFMLVIDSMKICRDAVEEGYRIDFDEFKKISDQITNPELLKQQKIKMLIPVYNVIFALQQTLQYMQAKDLIFNQLNQFGVLIELSKEETEMYLQNPTFSTALSITMNLPTQTKEESKEEVEVETTTESKIDSESKVLTTQEKIDELQQMKKELLDKTTEDKTIKKNISQSKTRVKSQNNHDKKI